MNNKNDYFWGKEQGGEIEMEANFSEYILLCGFDFRIRYFIHSKITLKQKERRNASQENWKQFEMKDLNYISSWWHNHSEKIMISGGFITYHLHMFKEVFPKDKKSCKEILKAHLEVILLVQILALFLKLLYINRSSMPISNCVNARL